MSCNNLSSWLSGLITVGKLQTQEEGGYATQNFNCIVLFDISFEPL